jgi:alpha-galactosidase
MLAQTMGSWQAPSRWPLPDAGCLSHHRGRRLSHGAQPAAGGAGGGWLLLAFASCQRFGGEFRLYPDGRLEIVMNAEGRTLPASTGRARR